MKIKVRPRKIFSPKGLKATLTEAGYCIFVAEIVDSLDSKYERYDIKLKGNSCSLDPKMVYSVDCKLESSHPQYGETYAMDFIRPDIKLESPEEIKGFLCMSLGDKKGELLFNEIPDIMNVLEEENVQALCEVKGISAKSATKIINKYNESKDFANVIGKLKSANLGLTDKAIKKLIKTFKNEETILDMVFNKTYDLVKYIDGWGFRKADEIALRNGTALDSPKRIKACIMHILSENGMKGIEYPSYLEVITQMNEIIGFIAQEPLGIACQELIKEEQVVLIDNAEFICSTEYYNLEKKIAKEIDRIGTTTDVDILDKISSIDIKSEIDRAEEVLGFKLAERQKDSVSLTINGKNVKITVGSSGTGKSSCSKLSLDILSKAQLSIACTSFTGKASLRIQEATGFEASTIHRLLAFNPQEGGFQYNSKCKLPYDVILLDEAGMVSAHLFLSLVQAIKDGAILIILGDIKQLVSISSGNILSDLLNSNKEYISKVELNEVQRQKGGSEILDYIQTILDQDTLVNSNYIGRKTFGDKKDAVVDIFTDSGAYVLDWIGTEFKNKLDRRSGNVMDVQILGATRIRGDLSLFNINNKIKSIYNPIDASRERFVKMMGSKEAPMDYIIEEKDKVIITKNLYKVITVDGEYTSIFNGNLGIVTMVTSENVSVKFDTGEEIILSKEEALNLELGYAITCHKSQGSEFKSAIVALDNGAYVLATNEWIYTAVSRGKVDVTVFAQNYIYRQAVLNREQLTKRCLLVKFLNGEIE